MVRLQAIGWSKSVPLKSSKLLGGANWAFSIRVGERVWSVLSVDLYLALDSQEDGIVHDLAVGEELGVWLHCVIDLSNIFHRHVNLLNMMLIADKVLVFESGASRCATLDQSAKGASFEIVDACYIILIIKA